MAVATKYESFAASNGITIYLIQTDASKINIVNLTTSANPMGQKVSESGYYGINGSFFNTTTGVIENIAFQDGEAQGGFKGGGENNQNGDSLIYYKNKSVYYANGVKSSSSNKVPKVANSWAQGGFGLYLGFSGWNELFEAENPSTDITGTPSFRTGMVCNTSTNAIYLVMCRIQVSVKDFRQAIMDKCGINDGNGNPNNPYWRAIMLDGGRSAQIYTPNFAYASPLVRDVAQIVGIAK